MSYTPGTDLLALLRQTTNGLRVERMPGLDYVVAALQRMGLVQLWIGQTAPVVNQTQTVWLVPASPSWSGEGQVLLWNATNNDYETATPTLWADLIAGPFLSLIPAVATANPLMDGAVAVGTSLKYAREDHRHPTDTTLAPINSPVLTGNPQAPTATFGDNSTSIATTAFVQETAGVVPPIGTIIAYAGPSAPSANYAILNGQAISRTAFATCFGVCGITFGSGDGITTFNVPDLRGRTIAGVDGGANRLTTATMNSQALGGIGGVETRTLITANLPAYTPGGSIGNGSITLTVSGSSAIGGTTGVSVSGAGVAAAGGTTNTILASQGSSTFTGSAQGGTSTAFGIVQPTIELNYIMRVS